MAEDDKQGVGAHARALKDDLSPDKVEGKLQEVVRERPKARFLLDFSIVAKALVAAVVIAGLLWLLVGPRLAAVALVVVFVGGWLLMAQLGYDRRRDTHEAGSPEPDESGYEGDRGEVEAQREQQGDEGGEGGEGPSRNGSAPDRQRTTG
ncbi:MAG TPA: hypothetical protein VF715_08680 [Thermoleophilaceae bacterium]